MKNTKIKWTDSTFNPWIGCTKVSPGCLNCYAEVSTPTRVARAAGRELWGPGRPRMRQSERYWKQPLAWNQTKTCTNCGTANLLGAQVCSENLCAHWEFRRPRVFCASLADWLDDEVPIEWLADLLALIHATPNLNWQLLTKRPENWSSRLKLVGDLTSTQKEFQWIYDWLRGVNIPANVWIGTTVEDQTRAEQRMPYLIEIPAAVKFLSVEPLLGPVDLSYWLTDSIVPQMQWVIAGGESGGHARPMHSDWARTLRDQCAAAGVPFFFKQWGEWAPVERTPEIHARCTMPAQTGDVWAWPDGTKDGWRTGPVSERVGKKAAGRLLDGVEHNAFPI